MLQLVVMRSNLEPGQWGAFAVGLGVVYLLDVTGALPGGDLIGPQAAIRAGLFYGGGFAASLAVYEIIKRILR